ncbi:MAG: arsenic efflux protein [Hadesarchaea archaeon]|nr:arsenic efflux protein [Hadesarchaea archaeon]
MIATLLEVLTETIKIIAMVFVLMVVIEDIEFRTERKISSWMVGGRLRQYFLSSFLGATPGCVGAFTSVSFYVHGPFSLGAITAAMVATSGDEAFVMLAKFPTVALCLFGLLFALGVVSGALMDVVAKKFGIEKCESCVMEERAEEQKKIGKRHFLEERIIRHVVRKHIPRLFLWVFFTLLAIALIRARVDLEAVLSGLPVFVLVSAAAVIGIIPGSGPHLPFVFLFADGAIPFSVLLASSIAQDGHGMLPMLSYTLRDSLIIKTFNVVYAIAVSAPLALAGY